MFVRHKIGWIAASRADEPAASAMPLTKHEEQTAQVRPAHQDAAQSRRPSRTRTPTAVGDPSTTTRSSNVTKPTSTSSGSKMTRSKTAKTCQPPKFWPKKSPMICRLPWSNLHRSQMSWQNSRGYPTECFFQTTGQQKITTDSE